MNRKKLLLTAAFVAMQVYNPGLALAAPVGDASPATPEAIVKTVLMKNNKGEAAGEVQLTETEGGVLVSMNLYKLPPGEHAIHIHEKGACTPAATFADAGAHLNPGAHPHGYMNDHGPHDGDLPNIFVDADGAVTAHVMNTRVKLDEEDTSNRALLNDGDGAAIVIHASPDDYATQPTGNAGDRIACGEIK